MADESNDMSKGARLEIDISAQDLVKKYEIDEELANRIIADLPDLAKDWLKVDVETIGAIQPVPTSGPLIPPSPTGTKSFRIGAGAEQEWESFMNKLMAAFKKAGYSKEFMPKVMEAVSIDDLTLMTKDVMEAISVDKVFMGKLKRILRKANIPGKEEIKVMEAISVDEAEWAEILLDEADVMEAISVDGKFKAKLLKILRRAKLPKEHRLNVMEAISVDEADVQEAISYDNMLYSVLESLRGKIKNMSGVNRKNIEAIAKAIGGKNEKKLQAMFREDSVNPEHLTEYMKFTRKEIKNLDLPENTKAALEKAINESANESGCTEKEDGVWKISDGLKPGRVKGTGVPKTPEQRAMAHYNISAEAWNKLDAERQKEYIKTLPELGSGRDAVKGEKRGNITVTKEMAKALKDLGIPIIEGVTLTCSDPACFEETFGGPNLPGSVGPDIDSEKGTTLPIIKNAKGRKVTAAMAKKFKEMGLPYEENEFLTCVGAGPECGGSEIYGGIGGIERIIDNDEPFFDSLDIEFITDSIEVTDGILKAHAVCAAAMVQDYNGTKILKCPDELKLAVDFAKRLPITDGHPPGAMVRNQKDVKGWTDDLSWNEEKQRIECDIEVTDGALIQKIEDGMTDVSIGFFCDLDHKTGVFTRDGSNAEYDAIQRNMVLNHLATGVKQGRCPEGVCGIGQDSITTDADVSSHEKLLQEKVGALKALGDDLSANAGTMKPEEIEAKVSQMSSIAWDLRQMTSVLNTKEIGIGDDIKESVKDSMETAEKVINDTKMASDEQYVMALDFMEKEKVKVIDSIMDMKPLKNRGFFEDMNLIALKDMKALMDGQKEGEGIDFHGGEKVVGQDAIDEAYADLYE